MRLPAHWRKLGRDLVGDPLRTALAVLSISVGVSAVGMVTGASATLTSTLDGAYRHAHTAGVTMVVAPFDDSTLDRVRTVPGVTAAEARHTAGVRVDTPGGWQNLTLTAVRDYGHLSLNRFSPQAGAWPPPDGEVLLERSTAGFLGTRVGGSLTVELPDGRHRELRVAGTVHDLNYPSARASGLLNGYVSFATLPALGEQPDYNQLLVATSGLTSRSQVETVATAVRSRLETAGHPVLADAVATPGRFWADDQIDASVLLLDVMAVVSFLMSAFLVGNIVAALVTRQTREIGVLKAVGASPRQVAALYLGSVTLYALVALALAIPAGAVGALAIVDSTQEVLNFDSPWVRVFASVVGLQAISALVVALVAGVGPVIAAGRLTVRQAISAGGSEGGSAGRWLRGLGRLPTPIRLATSNAVRRRGRALLTLLTLVLAGVSFIAVLSVRESVASTLDGAVATRGYDVHLTLAPPVPAGEALALAASAPGVATVERWTEAPAFRVRPDGSEGDTVQLVAPPAGSKSLHPELLSGRWLVPGVAHEVVINSDLQHAEPDLVPGSQVTLEVAGHRQAWQVVGVARGALTGPTVYALRDDVDALLGTGAVATTLAVDGTSHGAAAQASLARALVDRFTAAGHPVAMVETTAQWRDFLAADYGIAVNFLLGMAVLLAAVGGLSLAGMLSLNILERTREIGVLRALGATDGALRRLVGGEALAVAAIAWVAAAPVSPAGARVLSDAFGYAFLHVPLTFAYAWAGLAWWALLVAVLAVLSSLLPAWNASRLTVREVLLYE